MLCILKQIPRYLLGLIFLIFGLNFFLGFIPLPQPTPEGLNYLNALMATGYFFPLLKVTEILCAVLLLTGFFVPLALVVLAPIVLNILLYHAFLDPSGIILALVIVICFLLEVKNHCGVWCKLCKARCGRCACCGCDNCTCGDTNGEKSSCCK